MIRVANAHCAVLLGGKHLIQQCMFIIILARHFEKYDTPLEFVNSENLITFALHDLNRVRQGLRKCARCSLLGGATRYTN